MQSALRITVLTVVLAACSVGTAVTDIEVGDCFDDPEEVLVATVEVVDCSQPHDNEVFAQVDTGGVVFPGNDALREIGAEACLPEFEAYVGETFAESPLDYTFLSPSEESWEEGDRTFVCFLYSPDLSKLTGSAKG